MKKYFAPIKEAIKEIKSGKMLIVVDSPDRENEGDLFCPGQTITPKNITFMIHQGGGLICVAITKSCAAHLALPLLIEPEKNQEITKVSFTISVNAKTGITTGISAYDRAKTIKILANPNSKAEELTRPGHVFPLIAADEGLSQRSGHTEAAVELARLAGFSPAGVLCEIIKDDGRMARMPDLIKLSKKLNIRIVSIEDLVSFIKVNPSPAGITPSVVKTASSTLPTKYGNFHLSIYTSILDKREHAVMSLGNLENQPILTRIHSQCLTGDTFLSLKCDCREQLVQSMKMIKKRGRGLLIYLNQEGRGIGLSNKIKAYALQEKGLDTVEANQALDLTPDARDYKVAAEILVDLGVSKIILLTNNPDKIKQLAAQKIKIVKILPIEVAPNYINRNYLAAKKYKLHHRITIV